MNAASSRLGACDRCRGQKLRCVGAARPILIGPESRFHRNGIPCERCKRAKVECFGVKPAAPRRTAASIRNQDKRALVTSQSSSNRHAASTTAAPAVVPAAPQRYQCSSIPASSLTGGTVETPCSDQPLSLYSPHRNSPAADSPRSDHDLDNALSTMPTTESTTASSSSSSSTWMPFSQNGHLDWNDMVLGTPNWMLDMDMNMNMRGNSILDTSIDHSMAIGSAPSKAASSVVDWDAGQFQVDATTPVPPAASSDRRTSTVSEKTQNTAYKNNSNRSCRYSQQGFIPSYLDTPKTTCMQDLAKLHKILLCEQSIAEESPLSTPTNNGIGSAAQPTVGQTLQRCQDFLSVLQCLKRSCSISQDANESQLASDPLYSNDVPQLSHSGSSSNSSPNMSSLSSPTKPTASCLEIPTLLSVLSCYICLLQSFNNLFLPILDAIKRSTPTLPVILPGLGIDGFELDSHHTLQLECLTSVSLSMLDKIENILIGSSSNEGLLSRNEGGLHRNRLFAGLIDVLYDRHEQTSLFAPSNGKREARAKTLIREIQTAIKVIDF